MQPRQCALLTSEAISDTCFTGNCLTEIYRLWAQDDRGGQWRVQAVSVAPASFQNRKSLPKAWQGLRDQELSELAAIPSCVFVHASGEPPAAGRSRLTRLEA